MTAARHSSVRDVTAADIGEVRDGAGGDIAGGVAGCEWSSLCGGGDGVRSVLNLVVCYVMFGPDVAHVLPGCGVGEVAGQVPHAYPTNPCNHIQETIAQTWNAVACVEDGLRLRCP